MAVAKVSIPTIEFQRDEIPTYNKKKALQGAFWCSFVKRWS